MSKHKAQKKDNSVAHSWSRQPQDPLAKLQPRRTMLYALAAGTAVVIAFAIFMPSRQSSDYQLLDSTRPIEAQLAGPTVLATEAAFFDFGRISMAAGKVSHRYSIRNTGADPLTITQISTSCMCTAATLVTRSATRGPFGMAGHGILPGVNERLAQGELANVDVVFDPAAHGPAGVGPTSRVVTIANDRGPALELRFDALVTP